MKSRCVNIESRGELKYITFPKLLQTGTVRHAFTTRFGGVSESYLASMNMGFNRGDLRENVIKNYETVCGAIGIDTANLVFSAQTHTDNCVVVTEKDRGRGFSRPGFHNVDGLLTDRPGVALVTQFADCTPLVFCDPVRRAVASVHSGWRGTVKRIGQRAVDMMVDVFGSKREDIIAAIGPCIGGCCYEVDDPVYSAFFAAGFDPDKIFMPKENGKYMLDLQKANETVLCGAGILPSNIDIADICTCCNSGEMFSHRAAGVNRGNLAMIIELI